MSLCSCSMGSLGTRGVGDGRFTGVKSVVKTKNSGQINRGICGRCCA